MNASGLGDRKKYLAVLTQCAWCGIEGPSARYAEHLEQDHPELRDPVPGHPKYNACTLPVKIPERFHKRLDMIKEQTGKSYGQVIAAALDAQGLGRLKRAL